MHKTEQELTNIKNYPLEVIGDEEDIKREIKSFIKYVVIMPYIHK